MFMTGRVFPPQPFKLVHGRTADLQHCVKFQVNSRVGKIPRSRKWQPTPVFLLENSMDREAWQAIVHRVSPSRTQQKQLNIYIAKSL